MTKSDLPFEESESQITGQPKKSAVREATNPAVTTPSSKDTTATIPRIIIRQKEGEVKYRPLCEDPQQGIELLMRAIGVEDMDFLLGIFSQLAEAASKKGVINQADFDFMLSMVKGLKPKNPAQAMFAAQMAVMQFTMMKFPKQIMDCDIVIQLDSVGSLFNKLARAFATQFDVWNRSGGEQKVTVQNFSVNEGGQAIVGNITQNAPNDGKAKTVTTPAAITDTRAAPMPTIEQSELPVAVPAKRRARQ